MAPPSLLFDIFLLGVSRIQHYSFFSVDYHFRFLYSLRHENLFFQLFVSVLK